MRRILTTVSLQLACLCLLAQIPDDVPTPNAASLGKYGDVPVSYHTGQPDITIPLHTLSVHGVDLPVSLSYDANGMKMNSLPTWTGYCWTLSAGGCITRVMNGNPDEYVYPVNAHLTYGFTNYFKGHSRMTYYSHGNMSALLGDVIPRTRDMEPDMFYFNFMGHSGRFFLGNDGAWKVISDENIDVLYDVTDTTQLIAPFISKYPKHTAVDCDQPLTIPGFRLRDEAGTVYEFGFTTDAIEYSTHFLSMGDLEDVDGWLADAWYLTRVTDRFGNELYRLTYERGKFFAQFYTTAQWTAYRESFATTYAGTSAEYGFVSYAGSDGNPTLRYDATLNAPVYLTRIDAASGVSATFHSVANPRPFGSYYQKMVAAAGSETLAFSYLSGRVTSPTTHLEGSFYYLNDPQFSQYWADGYDATDPFNLFTRMSIRQLRSINVGGGNGTGRTFRLYYDDDGRMLLSSIHENYVSEGLDRVKCAYRMTYHHPELLPVDCLTDRVDHWGHFNGDTLYHLPQDESEVIAFKNHRLPHATKVLYGSLKKLTYPTGGATLLTFGPNRFGGYLNATRDTLVDSVGQGGGLRVERIEEYEDSACSRLLRRRSFSYVDEDGSSSGQMLSRPLYYWPDWEAKTLNSNSSVHLTTFRYNSILPLVNSFGPSVRYSRVVETLGDGGKTIYRYTNLYNPPNLDQLEWSPGVNSRGASPFDVFTERGILRGRLLSREAFNRQGTKVSSTSYSYSTAGERGTDLASSLRLRDGNYPGPMTDVHSQYYKAFYYCPGRVYHLYHGRCDVSRQVDTLFTANGPVVTTTDYSRSNHALALTAPYSHTAEARCLDAVTETRGTHTMSKCYGMAFSAADSDPAQRLAKQDYMLKPVSVTTFRDGDTIKTERTVYTLRSANNVTHALPRYDVAIYPGGGIDTLVAYNNYNSRGRLTVYRRLGGPNTFLRWCVNDCFLAARYRGSSDLLGFLSDESLLFNREQYFSSLRGIFYYFDSSFEAYSYDRMWGVTGVMHANGAVTRYDYGDDGRLATVKANSGDVLSEYEYNYRFKDE